MLSHQSFFDLSANKLHVLNLPLSTSPRTRICGSSHGWLVILDETREVRLLNPITRATLSRPSLHIFPEMVTRVLDDNDDDNNLFLIRIVLSSNPSLSDDFAAVAIFNRHHLAFCRKGYDSWVILNLSGNHHGWADAVYRNGSFFAVSMTGIIAVCDVEGSSSSSSPPQVSIIQKTETDDFRNICYTVFSGEDMLLVTRHFDMEFQPQEFGPDPNFWTNWFQVFKMNWNVLKWEKIQTLGEHSLFLGKNSLVSFSAADFTGFRPNCIYFIDDIAGKNDCGIFNLSDESIEPLLPCFLQNSYCLFGCPIWVTPNPL